MSSLLTLHEFRRIRDEIALTSMLERLPVLGEKCRGLGYQYRGLRRALLRTTNRNERDDLEYELYAEPSGEYGDGGGIAWRWARVDAEIGDIENDPRYLAYLEAQQEAS